MRVLEPPVNTCHQIQLASSNLMIDCTITTANAGTFSGYSGTDKTTKEVTCWKPLPDKHQQFEYQLFASMPAMNPLNLLYSATF
jgi:hypothetical protein